MKENLKLTATDQRALAILYCLYGHHPFLWHNRGKFQWYFGVTKRSRNRLIQAGLLTAYEVSFANHWLAFREVCQISSICIFDDFLIGRAIQAERESNWSMKLFFQDTLEPYWVNNPEYPTYLNWGVKGLVVRTEFSRLLETLPTESKYLLSNDRGAIKMKANYWPEAAIRVAMESLTIQQQIDKSVR